VYIVKINGVSHTVVVNEDGTTTYDPPLSEERKQKDRQNIKDMCRARKTPGVRTDTGFHAGRGTLLDQMEGDEQWTKHLVAEARKQGYNPGANDVYIGQLADKTGDRDAWFKPTDGRKELEKRLRKKGKGCDIPGLRVEPAPYIEKTGPQLNPKIVRAMERQYIASGEAGGMSREELRKHIVQKHGYKMGEGKTPRLGNVASKKNK
jgi:hypothetical protein